MNIMGPPRAKPLRHDVAAITQRYDRVALVLWEEAGMDGKTLFYGPA